MTPASLRALLEKYLEETMSKEEFAELWKTLQDHQYDDEWFNVIDRALANDTLHQLSDPDSASRALKQIKAKLEVEQLPVRHRRLEAWKIAASVIVITALGLFIWQYPWGKIEKRKMAGSNVIDSSNIARSRKVLLKLADGTTLDPDSLQNGSSVNIGKATLVKLSNGQVRYDASATGGASTVTADYNTMSTPAGKQYQLILPDGSKVWLNAQTRIIYPVAFVGNRRVVKVSGEAYFEVKPDKSRPFEVQAGNTSVEVVGTSFNVNAYPNEEAVKTSLLKGSVKINNQILVPGQAYANGKIFTTDVHQDVSWKDGVLNFNDQDFAMVMRTIARWYDLEVEYPNGIPQREYGGEMGTNLSLNQMLKGLENSGVQFKLVGRKLIVQP